jgi:hypothetical protein
MVNPQVSPFGIGVFQTSKVQVAQAQKVLMGLLLGWPKGVPLGATDFALVGPDRAAL